MTVTLKSVLASALAAERPPNPAPTMTTLLPMEASFLCTVRPHMGIRPGARIGGLLGSTKTAKKGSANEPSCVRPRVDWGDPLADRGCARHGGPAARGRGGLCAPDGRGRPDWGRRARRIPSAAICATTESRRVQSETQHHGRAL